MKTITFFLFCILLTVMFAFTVTKSNQSVFDTPYQIEVVNEHEVLLTTSNDTIRLYFENAYSLSEETVVFISKTK